MFDATMPRPVLDDPDTAPFWAGCRQHRLLVQQCTVCDAYRFAPVPICHACLSSESRWVDSRGTGEIYTWTICHRSYHPATRESLPYNAIVVRLDDCGGALITTNLVGPGANDAIHAGLRVRVAWDDLDDECSLPRFEVDSGRSYGS